MMACKDCKYHEDDGGYRAYGHCRRYPPTLIESETRFPKVSPYWHCGEFKQIENGEDYARYYL